MLYDWRNKKPAPMPPGVPPWQPGIAPPGAGWAGGRGPGPISGTTPERPGRGWKGIPVSLYSPLDDAKWDPAGPQQYHGITFDEYAAGAWRNMTEEERRRWEQESGYLKWNKASGGQSFTGGPGPMGPLPGATWPVTGGGPNPIGPAPSQPSPAQQPDISRALGTNYLTQSSAAAPTLGTSPSPTGVKRGFSGGGWERPQPVGTPFSRANPRDIPRWNQQTPYDRPKEYFMR